jgi:hypothetical protein
MQTNRSRYREVGFPVSLRRPTIDPSREWQARGRPAGSPLGSGAVLGIVNDSSVLVKTIPQSSNSHSVAADERRNLIFVPQVAFGVIGGDTNTTAGANTRTARVAAAPAFAPKASASPSGARIPTRRALASRWPSAAARALVRSGP